jgi:hypothetical protein
MRIKLFTQFVLENVNPINEGGKIFDGTTTIKKEDVDGTIKDIEERLFSKIGLTIGKNVIRIGSAGHTDISGDIDFGIVGIPFEDLHKTLVEKFPDNEINYMKGLEVLSLAWPINGDKDDGLVQVDLIPVYDRDWTEFVYKFPEGSKYKSAHRNWLMMAVLSAIKKNVEKDPETGKALDYDGYMMNLNKGFFSMKKDYHGKTKILKHGEITEEKLITTDPEKFVRFVFGKRYKPEDVGTFERCLSIINKSDFKWRSKLHDIKKNLRKFLERVELLIPKELE